MEKNFKMFNLIALPVFIIFLSATGYCLSEENDKTSNDISQNSSQKSYPLPHPLQRAEFSTFIHAMETAGLGEIYKGTGPFTGFIPSNEAFEKLDKKTWDDLLKPENQDKLAVILTYHIVPGKYSIDNLIRMAPKQLKTISGKYLDITAEKNEVRVNNIIIIQPNLEGPNFMVHKIDTVLTPK